MISGGLKQKPADTPIAPMTGRTDGYVGVSKIVGWVQGFSAWEAPRLLGTPKKDKKEL